MREGPGQKRGQWPLVLRKPWLTIEDWFTEHDHRTRCEAGKTHSWPDREVILSGENSQEEAGGDSLPRLSRCPGDTSICLHPFLPGPLGTTGVSMCSERRGPSAVPETGRAESSQC